jgi:hypothetical protein
MEKNPTPNYYSSLRDYKDSVTPRQQRINEVNKAMERLVAIDTLAKNNNPATISLPDLNKEKKQLTKFVYDNRLIVTDPSAPLPGTKKKKKP